MAIVEPKYFTLNTLFADRVFRIPHYQRFYSWEKPQRDDLFGDLMDLYRKDASGDRHHFMATIVCYRTGEKKPVKSVEYNLYEIVDGQQRITTLVLLIKALQRRLEDEDVKKEIGRILVRDDENLLLLQTNNVNQHLFNSYLRDGKPPDLEEVVTHADANLHAAVQEIDSFLDRWQAEGWDLMDLFRLIRNRIGLVVYDTEESYAVYTIFECLNSRGLEVDWLDKAKSVLMGIAFERSKSQKAATARISELQDLWGKIYNEMALCPIEGHEILRVTATLHMGMKMGKLLSAKDSIEKLREYCDEPSKTVEVTGWLQAVTRKLVKLQTDPHRSPVNRILQVRALGVALMLTDLLNDDQQESALDQWERVSFRIYGLCGKDSRTKVGEYVRLAARIVQQKDGASDYEGIMSELRDLGWDYPVDYAVRELLKEPRYEGFEEECRYLLWRYEEYLADKQGAKVNKELREKIWAARSASETIEHIFPQTPKVGGPWKGKLKPGQRTKDHVDRLGNLLLLPPGLNSEAGRRSFLGKKQVYRKAEGLRIVGEVLKSRDWTQMSIASRDKRIGKFLRETFADIA